MYEFDRSKPISIEIQFRKWRLVSFLCIVNSSEILIEIHILQSIFFPSINTFRTWNRFPLTFSQWKNQTLAFTISMCWHKTFKLVNIYPLKCTNIFNLLLFYILLFKRKPKTLLFLNCFFFFFILSLIRFFLLNIKANYISRTLTINLRLTSSFFLYMLEQMIFCCCCYFPLY